MFISRPASDVEVLIAPGQGDFASALAKEFSKNNPHTSVFFPKYQEYKQNEEGIFIPERGGERLIYPSSVPIEVVQEGVREKAFDLIILGFNGLGLLNETSASGKMSCETFLEIAKTMGWYNKDTAFLVLAKSLLAQGKLPFQVVREMLPKHSKGLIGALGGGNFAKEIGDGPLEMSIAFESDKARGLVHRLFQTDACIVETTRDVIGVQAAGVKNPLAILSGLCDGLSLPQNTKTILMRRAYLELEKLIILFGGKKETAKSPAGMGDLNLTLSSPKSRNYRFGEYLGRLFSQKGKGEIVSQEEIQHILESPDKMDKAVVEGFNSIGALYDFLKSKEKNAFNRVKIIRDFPLIRLVYKVVVEGKDPRKEVDNLIQLLATFHRRSFR